MQQPGLAVRGLWSRDKEKWWVPYFLMGHRPVPGTSTPQVLPHDTLGCPWCFLGQGTTCRTEEVKNIWVQT